MSLIFPVVRKTLEPSLTAPSISQLTFIPTSDLDLSSNYTQNQPFLTTYKASVLHGATVISCLDSAIACSGGCDSATCRPPSYSWEHTCRTLKSSLQPPTAPPCQSLVQQGTKADLFLEDEVSFVSSLWLKGFPVASPRLSQATLQSRTLPLIFLSLFPSLGWDQHLGLMVLPAFLGSLPIFSLTHTSPNEILAHLSPCKPILVSVSGRAQTDAHSNQSPCPWSSQPIFYPGTRGVLLKHRSDSVTSFLKMLQWFPHFTNSQTQGPYERLSLPITTLVSSSTTLTRSSLLSITGILLFCVHTRHSCFRAFA